MGRAGAERDPETVCAECGAPPSASARAALDHILAKLSPAQRQTIVRCRDEQGAIAKRAVVGALRRRGLAAPVAYQHRVHLTPLGELARRVLTGGRVEAREVVRAAGRAA